MRTENLHKVYESGDGYNHALKDVNLEVHEGEFLSLVGKSGCGKTTLLNLLAGLDRPTHGRILLKDSVVTGARPDQIGYIFQQPVLLPWRKIIDNVLLNVEIMGLSRKKHVDRADELLDLVGLDNVKDLFPHQLSGGMQQRVAIVRALIHEPALLLMDEPFGALDALTRDHMNVELLRIWGTTDTTVVFVTHDLREAAFLSDRIAVMSSGPGMIREIVESPFDRPRNPDVIHSDEFSELTNRLEGLIA
jgi:NitT/TauT family transport system ATP-binding protein